MLDPQRLFDGKQRAAIFRMARGRCRHCGEPLGSGWHADHIIPHSRGGRTDVTNGQALCRACSLAKGAIVPKEPRHWQRLFLNKYRGSNPEDFLLVACPGAGKTMAAVYAAKGLLQEQAIERILVVVPSYPLRKQWYEAFQSEGVLIDYWTSNNEYGGEARTFDGRRVQGWVITYQSLMERSTDHRGYNAARPTLVILDEVHHLQKDGAWGRAALEALSPCVRRLALSGTPFRTDGTQIPFVEYEQIEEGLYRCKYKDGPDGSYPKGFDYSYGVALVDHNPTPPVRPVVFEHYDGDVEWMEGVGKKAVTLSAGDVDSKTRRRARRHVLNPAGEWLTRVLSDADERLSGLRAEGDSQAKGLIVCLDVEHADRVADRLQEITRQVVHRAVSTDERGVDQSEKAREIIENFGSSDARWLVAVRMVTEGVDIPQLRVCVYATTARTDLLFRQIVGRVVRRRADLPEDVDQIAHVFVPKDPEMIQLANLIQEEVALAMISEEIDTEEPAPSRDGEGEGGDVFDPDQLNMFLGATPGESGYLVPGHGTLTISRTQIEKYAAETGCSTGVAAKLIAILIREGASLGDLGIAPNTEQPPPADPPDVVLTRLKKQLDGHIKQCAQLMQNTGRGKSELGRTIASLQDQVRRASGIYQDPYVKSPAEKAAYSKRADVPALKAAIELTKNYMTELLNESGGGET